MSRVGMDYHGALNPLAEACRKTGSVFVNDLMCAPHGGSFIAALRRRAVIASRHARFADGVQSDGPMVLVRDFSNIPLAMVFSKLATVRDRLFFIVNHNLQWALRGSIAERVAFKQLGRMGCRFVFFELVPKEALRSLGMDPLQGLILPHPVSDSPQVRVRSGGLRRVGVVGEYRPEKGVDELLQHLLGLPNSPAICVGTPDVEGFRRRSPFGKHPGIELRSTATTEEYFSAIADCDAVVLNHPERAYQYRASGLIADAAATRVPVIVRRQPVLEVQTTFPVSVGECFDSLDDLTKVFESVDRKLCAGAYRFEEYKQSRSGAALATRLMNFPRGSHG
jgi:glycosyltransferase involved in cell wall biosynthesis